MQTTSKTNRLPVNGPTAPKKTTTAPANGKAPVITKATTKSGPEQELASYELDGNCLVIRLPLRSPEISSTGKTFIVGNVGREDRRTGFAIDGKEITVSCVAMIPAK